MPRVPTLPGAQVDTKALPTPYGSAQASPDAFGAGVAGAFGDAAQIGAAIYQRERQKNDLAVVQRNEALLRQHANDLMWGDKGLGKLEGENAFAVEPKLYESFDKRTAELSASLADDHQRQAFGTAAINIRDSFKSGAEHYLSQQRRHVQVEGLKGALATTKASIANGFTDPRTVDEGMTAIESNLRAYGTAHGVPAAETTALIGKEQAEAARSVIYGYLSPGRQDSAGAAAAYAQFHDKLGFLPENERHVLESAIGHTSTVQLADAKAMDVVKRSMGPDGQVDRRKAQGIIDSEITAGPVKDETQRRVDHKSAIFDSAWKDEATTMAANVAIASLDPVTGERDLARVNQADLAALGVKWPSKLAELRKAVALEGSKQRYAQAVEHYFGGPDNWQNTARMPPNEFLTDSVMLSLPAKHRTALIERYQAQQKNLNVAPSESLVLEESRKALGLGDLKIGQLPPEKQEAFADLFDAVHRDVRQFAIDHQGQRPDKESLRKMVREETQVVASRWFSPDVLRFQTGKQIGRARAQPTTAPASLAVPLPPTDVRVIAPDGSRGTIPTEKLQDALKQGYRLE